MNRDIMDELITESARINISDYANELFLHVGRMQRSSANNYKVQID
jgi:hypothetical protein